MKTVNIIAHTENVSQLDALKAFMKDLNIKFEISKEKPYNEAFVEMVAEAEIEIKKGKGKKVTTEEFDNLWK